MENSEHNYLSSFWCGIFEYLEIALFKIHYMVRGRYSVTSRGIYEAVFLESIG